MDTGRGDAVVGARCGAAGGCLCEDILLHDAGDAVQLHLLAALDGGEVSAHGTCSCWLWERGGCHGGGDVGKNKVGTKLSSLIYADDTN